MASSLVWEALVPIRTRVLPSDASRLEVRFWYFFLCHIPCAVPVSYLAPSSADRHSNQEGACPRLAKRHVDLIPRDQPTVQSRKYMAFKSRAQQAMLNSPRPIFCPVIWHGHAGWTNSVTRLRLPLTTCLVSLLYGSAGPSATPSPTPPNRRR